MRNKFWIGLAVGLTGVLSAFGSNVFVTRFWHDHQPIYWPDWNANGAQTVRVQYAWDSYLLAGSQQWGTGQNHPSVDLSSVFNVNDRIQSYQNEPRDSLSSVASAGGFAMSYTGSLIDNVRNLGANNQWGYGSGWWDGNRQARSWLTPSGSRRLDLVGFAYHHSLGPVLPKSVLRKEVDIFKQAYWKAWNGSSDLSDHSKGFFPTEMAFSSTMVDVLADEGYQWTIVASHHLSRTCPTYGNQTSPTNFSIFSSPPNRADQLGPSPTTGWWYGQPNPGNAAWNVSPFAYQLHRVKYVNPATGAEKSLIAVPSDDVESYVAGYSGAQIPMISANISPYATDASRPVLVMPATDGDNAWGGGSSSWMDSTPGFFSGSVNAGYNITTIQDFVNQHPPPANDFVNVEDGAWIFPESDYGSPYFLKWVEPPIKTTTATNTYPGTIVDLETPGFSTKFWSWAPIMAGANWCETAEQMWLDASTNNSVQAWKIQAPYDWSGAWTGPNIVEQAWHIYLCGLDTGFNYYGGLGNDDEVKASLATRRAIETLQTFVNANLNNDRTPPTVFRPQRFPWNPGGYTFGWFNSIPGGNTAYLKKMPSDFYIWTHAYDVSGVSGVTLKVRMDNDGVNSLANNDNETYAGGPDVGPWTSLAMTKRVLPNDRASLNAAANNSQIDYFITGPAIADYYFAKITQSSLPNFRGKLLDYYIEAVDTRGNTNRTDIQHVFVENDGASLPVASAATFSADPRNCAPLTITYSANAGALSNSVPVVMQISFNAGTNWSPYTMTNSGGGTSVYTIATIPQTAPSATVWFQNTNGTIVDSQSGQNWSTAIRDCNAPTGPGTADTSPSNPNGCSPVTLRYFQNAGALQTATQIYAHVGRNGWQNVMPSDPPMTKFTNRWEYIYQPPAGTLQIDAVFNNGAGTWDNHSSADWHFAVSNCNPIAEPSGVAITNPLPHTLTVSNEIAGYPLFGTCGTNIIGNLSWTNSLTGGSDTLFANQQWNIASVPLAVGTNIITVSGVVSVGGIIFDAQDSASNAAYGAGWISGTSAGSGFGAWQFATNLPAGQFRATSGANSNLNIGGIAWGLWANSNGLSDAVRPLTSPLTTAQTFSVQFENNWIQNGGSVGIGLQNASGGNLFQLIFFGGATNYTIYDSASGRDSGIVYTDTGLALDFSLTATDSYRAVINGAVVTGQLASATDRAIAKFRAYNYQAGVGSAYDTFLNSLRITRPGAVVTSNDTVTIIRQPAVYFDGIPMSWWNRYGLGTNSAANADSDGDGQSNWQEYIADTNPTNAASVAPALIFHTASSAPMDLFVDAPTTNSRLYDIWIATDLFLGGWTPQNFNLFGSPTGGALRFSVTNNLPGAFYRTGVKLP